MKNKILILCVLAALLLAGTAQAMYAGSYDIPWIIPMSAGGVGKAHSAGYAVDLTVGQAVIGDSASSSYGTSLGFWQQFSSTISLFLPVVRVH